MYPPSAGTAVPVGAKQAQLNGSSSVDQISRCVSIGKWLIERPFDTAPLTAQPVEAQAAEIVSAIRSAVSPSYSKPPNSLGRQVRSNSASRNLSMMCGKIVRLRSVSSARARISGTMARARSTSSSGLGTARRRTAAVVIRAISSINSAHRGAARCLKFYRAANRRRNQIGWSWREFRFVWRAVIVMPGEDRVMARTGSKLIDAEMHVMEPTDLWQRYIDPEFRTHAPRRLDERRWDIRTLVEGEVMAQIPGGDWPALSDAEAKALAERYAEEIARNFDPETQV